MADQLSFGDGAFDILVFSFCLYLCDRDDIFSIAREANRVSESIACMIVYDFSSSESVKRNYYHRLEVFP
jgi:ubiquinone/menaquinone biosynthesis C-methylase UbiE